MIMNRALRQRTMSPVISTKLKSNDTFEEWADELEQYKSASLKRESNKKLNSTKRQFDQLLRSMRSAEVKWNPSCRHCMTMFYI